VNLVSPVLNCNRTSPHYNTRLDGDPPCLIYKLSDIPQFSFTMDCKFLNFTSIIEGTDRRDIANGQNALNQNFTYFVLKNPSNTTGATFSISMDSHSKFQYKVFDFNHMADATYKYYVNLTADHYLGNTYLSFILPPLNTIPNRFMSGGRIYYEAGFEHSPSIPYTGQLIENNIARGFIDVSDFLFPDDPIQGTPVFWVVFGSIAIVLMFSTTIYFLFRSKCVIVKQKYRK